MLYSVPGHIQIKGSTLTIFNVEESRDEGMYQCAATNTYGTTFSSGQLTVLCKLNGCLGRERVLKFAHITVVPAQRTL